MGGSECNRGKNQSGEKKVRAYRGDPTENVGVEREVMLRDVQSTLDEDLSLKCASIV